MFDFFCRVISKNNDLGFSLGETHGSIYKTNMNITKVIDAKHCA